jgi:16S rRNA (cytidine1402-2'-O)-methyltransferase
MTMTTGTLYLVATPIGNLEDITHRAVRILREVDLIACEDTRRTRVLLDHYQIKAKLLSYHEHNEKGRAAELGAQLESGADVALVSDAGTPCISDPGYRLVRESIKCGARVVPVPGATAFVSALIASGLPTNEFFFGGFLPARTAARRARLSALSNFSSTLIFYEAPHRIIDTLRDAHEILGEREAVIARELTKVHEEIARGLLSELLARYETAAAPRGEIILIIDRHVIAPAHAERLLTEISVATRVAALEVEGFGTRAALKKVAHEMNMSRSEAYRRLLAERARKSS